MLDIEIFRRNAAAVKESLKKRNLQDDGAVDRVVELDEKKRKLTVETDELRHRRKELSEKIGRMRKTGESVDSLVSEVHGIKERLDSYEEELRKLEEEIQATVLRIPNVLDEAVPEGKTSEENKVIREWGEKRSFGFEVKPHYEIGAQLGILDMERGAMIAGSHFPLFIGTGAALCRALINFMLDTHTQNGYIEVSPPFVANRVTMTGTGQLPKFEEDMYRIDSDDFFLIPTAEVPLTSLHRDQILSFARLPLRYTSYTPCFRREAGAYGAKTRGLLRVHQFDKVELMVYSAPKQSPSEHEKILKDAENIIQKLGLPYRVVLLCGGETGFSARKCYDIELWAPGVGQYLEVSSVSNFGDFQARRLNIRYREPGGKVHFAHTLNGSGVALPRLIAAILENYQNEDGSVTVPEVLRSYIRGLERIVLPLA